MTDQAQLRAAYRFDLPEDLIAQEPANPRDTARLLVLRQGAREHRIFRDLPAYLRAGDVLVLNDTRVIGARLYGSLQPHPGARPPTTRTVELLLLRPSHQPRYDPHAVRWHALAKPARRLRPGACIGFGEFGTARVVNEIGMGMREIVFDLRVPFERFLEETGHTPLPPYIRSRTSAAAQQYQTIFAREPGSVAAPTASLHFTGDVLDALAGNGVEIVTLVLQVGIGTFRPMQTDRLDEHVMHPEYFSIPSKTQEAIARAKAEGRRVVAAGTTVVRALEGSAAKHGAVRAGDDVTDLFIKPGFRFAVVDALITNFHLPESTLLVLVSAFAGRETVLRAYREAVARRYRFFSFGDAMFIVRG